MDGSGGDDDRAFVLEGAAGMSARLASHGATLMALEVPDRERARFLKLAKAQRPH